MDRRDKAFQNRLGIPPRILDRPEKVCGKEDLRPCALDAVQQRREVIPVQKQFRLRNRLRGSCCGLHYRLRSVRRLRKKQKDRQKHRRYHPSHYPVHPIHHQFPPFPHHRRRHRRSGCASPPRFPSCFTPAIKRQAGLRIESGAGFDPASIRKLDSRFRGNDGFDI